MFTQRSYTYERHTLYLLPVLDSKNLQIALCYQSRDRLDEDVNFREACHLHTPLLDMRRAQAAFPTYLALFYTDGAMQSWIFYPKMFFLLWVISKAVKHQLFTGKQQRLSCFPIGVTCCGRAAMKLQLSHCINYGHLNYLLIPCNQLGTLLHTGQIHLDYSALLQWHPWVCPVVLIFLPLKLTGPLHLGGLLKHHETKG